MIGSVAKNRLWNLRHDRAAMVLAFVVPIVFFSIFASIFGGSGRSTARRVRVAVVDEDGSEASKRFVEALRGDAALSLVDKTVADGGNANGSAPFTASSAEAAVRAGDFPVALVIPKGFGSVPLRFGPGERRGVTRLAEPSDATGPEGARGCLQKTAATLAAPPDGGRPDPAIVAVTRRDVIGETKKNGMVPFYAAGLGVMFLLFSATGAGGALLEEVESGTLDRILSTRVNMTTLLGGKLLYLAGFGATQLLVMFVWGAIAFGLELSRHWAGFLVMTACTAFATSAFGLLLASISRSRMQLVALSNLFVLVMSALGGSMYPRFLMPEAIQKAGLLTLNAWAIDGFLKVFWREEPVVNLWPQVLVLCAIGTVLFLAARRIARRWDGA